MSLAALENALADAMYANAAAGKINTEAYGLNKDEMASVMAATIKTYHLSSAVTDLGYETNAAGVVTAVTFTGSSGMTSAMESMTNSDDEVIAQQADSYAQAYVAENSDTFAASAAADGHTYGEPKWYWNDTNPEDGHTHTWKETPDGYWTKTDDGWAYTAVYTCEKDDAYQKVEGTVTKDTTDAKPGVAGKTVYSASVPADKSPLKKEYKEPTTRTDDIAALPCQSHAVPKDADGKFVATFNWEMKKVEGKLADDYSNAQLFYDSETGKISAGAPVTIDWECTSVTFKCAVCGEEIKTQPVMTMPVSVVVDQNNNSVYINVGGTPTLDTTSGGTGVTLVSAMDGGNWYDMQNNPVDASKVNFTYQSGDNKGKNSLLLYDSQKTAVYVDDQGNQVTNTYDVSTAQMNYYYFQLSQFNQDEAEYFGVVAPFWTSKGVQKQGEDGSITGTMGAIKILCSMDPNDNVPPTTMAFMLNMLPQAFMSYVMNYGEALKAIRNEGLKQVAELGDADYVTKLLILHDWISQVAEFDMGSMGDITGGGNNDPIQTTAFGALLGGEIGAKGVEYGCICLGYAAAFNYMVQNLPDNKSIYKNDDGSWKTPDEVGDNAVVDFAQILYYCDTSDTSVAGNAFGGGMFNNVHYFNAVKVNKLQGDSNSATMTTGEANKNWYYVDVCYDDVNTECMAQTRVENAGDLRHVNFLVSPSGLEGRYSKYYDYIDSLYDGYTYTKNKNPDVDDDGNVVLNNGKPHYSYTKAENKNETRYTDTCYEDTWFTSICSPIYFDNNYFYYVDTTTNQNLYNNMRRQQSENGNNGNSGSGSSGSSSSGNNSQMQQFMKKMQNQGPDTLEARPRTANYYIRKADSSSSGGFSMSSFTKTDDPFDIVLMYYNDLKKTSSNFNDDDSNAEVLAKAGTIYKIDSSAADSNLNTECLADAAAKRIYPALVHSTALYDGKLYFNVNNAIYRMDPTTGAVEEVKEYNTVYGGIKLTKDKDGNMVPDTHFPGMSMVIMDSAQDTSSVKYLGTFKNHPLAGLTLRDSYSFATTTQQGQTVITGINTTKDQLVVSVGTNLSNTYKSLDELGEDGKPVVKTDDSGLSYDQRKSYKTESWNYNPSYNQNMGSSDEKNKNEEFMWCANLVESMPMSDMVSDLSSGATTNVSVEAWCDTPAYTQDRTTKYGLTKGEKKYADGALPKGHTWALDELETKSVGNNVYLCSDCHTATESTPHTVTWNEVEGVKLTLGTTNKTYIKDDTVTLTVEKEGTDIVTVTAKNGDTDVALTEVQEAAQDEAAAQATTEKAKTVYTFTMPDGDVTISVTKNAKTYAVNVASLTNGEITASAKEAAEKETVTLTAKPATGYALKAGSLKVTYKDADNTDKTVEVKAGTEANTYTFAMPAYPVNVSAEFVKEYKVTAAPAENGTVTVDPAAAVEGTDVTVTVTAANNYQLKADSLTYSYQIGEDTKTEKLTLTDGKATFKMPAADVTVDAKFEAIPAKTYGITSDVTNGTAKLSVETAAVGDTVEVTFTANGENYKLEESSVRYEKKDDTSTAKALTLTDDKYSFTMPDYDVVVKAVFAKTTHTVTCNVTNGTATVDPTGEIKEGTNVTVTFKPDEDKANYVLKENPKLVSGNMNTTLNVSNGVGTFEMSKNDVTITAEFVEPESTKPTTPSEGDNTSDNTNNGGEETQALEAEERTVHGAAEKTTITAMAVFTCTDKNCASAQFVDATVKQTSGVTTATVNFNGKDYTAKYGEKNGWVEENGKKYWYENGVKQGTTGRGKEIYDPDSDAWYWLDAVQGGAMTVSKDVYQESAAGQWADKPDGTGKWVRYDENGHMVKGWQTTDKGTYYFDLITGAMAKGAGDIDGVPCAFDEYTGIALDGQWLTINGADFWYEKGVRQGLDGRGKEIYDPASDAWYWLDAVDQGKKATSKDVYQESKAGQWADRADGTGKWVRYDAQGHMIKGWSADKRYYFDPIYGTMAKGDAVIDGRTYHFDKNTGVLQ